MLYQEASDFSKKNSNPETKWEPSKNTQINGEYIFLLDISDSMTKSKLKLMKKSAIALLY